MQYKYKVFYYIKFWYDIILLYYNWKINQINKKGCNNNINSNNNLYICIQTSKLYETLILFRGSAVQKISFQKVAFHKGVFGKSLIINK